MKFEIDHQRPFVVEFKKKQRATPAVRLSSVITSDSDASMPAPFSGVVAMGIGVAILLYIVIGVAGILGLLGFIFGIVNFVKCRAGERFSHQTTNLVGFLLNLLVPIAGQFVGGSMCIHAAHVGKCS